MRNNGFTLVELLATIVIIGLIGGIGAVAYSMIMRNSENRVYEAYESTMHAETLQLLANNPQLLPHGTTEKLFTLSQIKIDNINNPRNKNDLCPSSFVGVTRNGSGTMDSFTYRVCLICNDYNSDGSNCKTFEN